MTMNLPKSADVFSFLTEATKEQSKLRMAISGPSGTGKTFSGINILMEMGCQNVIVLDTEHGSAAKYSNEFPRKFKVIDNKFWQSVYDPRRLIAVLKQIGPTADGIVCDSLTHFWMGPGGFLSVVDQIAKKNQARGGKYDSFGAWKEADPIYNELVQTILALPCHFIATLRAKSEYEDQVIDGKKKKVKVGLASQMRDGFEYEFDVEGMMTMDHEFVVGKTRCRALDGKIFTMPGENIAKPLMVWLTDGAPVERPSEKVPVANIPMGEPDVEPKANVLEDILDAITGAVDEATLKGPVRDAIKKAVTDKLISSEEYNSKVAPAYSEKSKSFKVAGAA